MSFPTFTQDPQDRLDYEVDWADWLPTGDTVIASAWASSDPVLVLEDDAFTTTSAVVFVSGGTLGQSYLVTNHIETGQGREKDQTLKIKIKSQ